MKFRSKILLAIWGVVLMLLVITYFVINYWTRVQVESRFAGDLRSNYSLVKELETLRGNEIVRSCQIVAETPRLKAVVEIGDKNTADQLCQELNQNMKCDVFIVTDARKKPLVELVEGTRADISSDRFPSFQAAIHGEVLPNIWTDRNAAYRVASAPLTIGSDTVGTLTIGFKIRRSDIQSIRAMTNSSVLLAIDSSVIISTLEVNQDPEILPQLRLASLGEYQPHDNAPVFTIRTADDQYAATWYQLGRSVSHSAGFLLIKPIEAEVRAVLIPLLRTFVILSVIVLLITAGIGFVISEGITRPIAALVNGTWEISRGNYDYQIVVGGGGEMKYLAQKFEEMSRTLKEKISQLAERNAELEETLRQLRETQAELVKSERLAATGKLTAQLSHEINNPIHNIQSCLQTTLRKMDGEAPGRDLLEVAYEEVERLANLTRQMLDVYRTSMVELQREPVCINDIIQEVVISSAAMLEKNGISVVLKFEPALPQILGSKDKLKQVFLNLLVNARDAMPGGGRVMFESARRNGHVVVDVSDTGIGIPPEHIDRIFDAFFTTKSSVSGVGLGLSVTYGIVRQHEGTVAVRSTVGKGTTFSLSFPVATL